MVEITIVDTYRTVQYVGVELFVFLIEKKLYVNGKWHVCSNFITKAKHKNESVIETDEHLFAVGNKWQLIAVCNRKWPTFIIIVLKLENDKMF